MPKSKSSPSPRTPNHALVVTLLLLWSVFWGLYGASFNAARHRHTADVVQNSIVRLDITTQDERHGTCTGFVIAQGRVMTAKHCTEDGPITADGKPMTVKFVDEYFDLALLAGETARPALTLRRTELMRGDYITAIGYAGGSTFLVQMPGELLNGRGVIEKGLAPCIMMSFMGIPGMSGGPIVDEQGRLVSVVSRGFPGLSCGMSPELLKAFLYSAG